MNPVFFGHAPHSLFGVYHAPLAAKSRRVGVVLCYPFGQEYMRAHRAFRQLAMLLSKAGFHVFRFDYYGTGDSAGDATEASLDQWVADAGAAADELKATAEVPRIAFVGLRLGAAVAALAAAARNDVDRVVLWDPAVRGADYLAEITEARTDSVGNSRHTVRDDGSMGVVGFPITSAFGAELRRLDLLQVNAPCDSSRFVVTSHARDDFVSLGRPRTACSAVQLAVIPSEGNWNEVDDYGGALIPVALIQAIVSHLAQDAA